MANICRNTIAVVGLQEPPEEFIKKLSKAMFDIDLDNMDPGKWGFRAEGGKLYHIFRVVDEETGQSKPVRQEVDTGNLDTSKCEEGKYYDVAWHVEPATGKPAEHLEEIDPKTWYQKILARKVDPPLGVLVPRAPFTKYGVTVPRFDVETKWDPVYEEVEKALKTFPDLLFDVQYFVEDDGPTGEFVMRKGRLLDYIRTGASQYLFDEVKYPTVNLLPYHMGLTLAQQGASKLQDAVEAVEQLRSILDDNGFIDSPFHDRRDGRKLSVARSKLDNLLAVMRQTAQEVSFEGVFLEEAERPTPLYETDRPTMTLEEQLDALKKF